MINPYSSRRSGRTTWMYIRALARLIESDQKRLKIVFPKHQMAKYGMNTFVELIEDITKGTAEIKVIKSKMEIHFMGKVIIFEGMDLPIDTKGCKPIVDEFKDHTCFE